MYCWHGHTDVKDPNASEPRKWQSLPQVGPRGIAKPSSGPGKSVYKLFDQQCGQKLAATASSSVMTGISPLQRSPTETGEPLLVLCIITISCECTLSLLAVREWISCRDGNTRG